MSNVDFLAGNELKRVTLAQSGRRPDLDFVLPGLLAGSVGMIVGAGAIGKSFLSLQIGIGVVSGCPIAGGLWPAMKRGPVTIIMGEDDTSILQERLYWIRQMEGIDDAAATDIDEKLTILSARGIDMRLIQENRDGFTTKPFFDKFVQICEAQRLVIIDPLLFLNGGKENDNNAAAMLMSMLYSVIRATGTTIILLHHTPKQTAEEKNGIVARDEWAMARGASAFTTSVRWQVNMMGPGRSLPEDRKDEADQWVRVSLVKANYGPKPEPAWLRRCTGGVLKHADPHSNLAPQQESAAKYATQSGSTKRKRNGGLN